MAPSTTVESRKAADKRTEQFPARNEECELKKISQRSAWPDQNWDGSKHFAIEVNA